MNWYTIFVGNTTLLEILQILLEILLEILRATLFYKIQGPIFRVQAVQQYAKGGARGGNFI